MSDIMTDLGENLEYVKTIAQNKLELKKLDVLENISNLIAYAILFVVSFILLAGFVIIGLIGLVVWLAHLLGSYPIATLIVAGTLLVLTIFIVLLRNPLIFNPIKKKLFASTLKS